MTRTESLADELRALARKKNINQTVDAFEADAQREFAILKVFLRSDACKGYLSHTHVHELNETALGLFIQKLKDAGFEVFVPSDTKVIVVWG